MALWYKHDIAAWMDGTEELDEKSYRAYHVICQLIYLNEGPIHLNEHGIAGRCNQHILTFRAALKRLFDLEKLTVTDGKVSNTRAISEVGSIKDRRRSRKDSAEIDNRSDVGLPDKSLKNKDASSGADATRLEETRKEETRKESLADPSGPAPRKRSKSKSTLQTDIQINTIQRKFAQEAGFPDAELETLFQGFKNHHIAKGSVMSDWDAAWRTWVTNDLKWRPARQKSLGVYGEDFW